jgi:hypothetical protein
MTIAELIELLAKLPQDADILVEYQDCESGDMEFAVPQVDPCAGAFVIH